MTVQQKALEQHFLTMADLTLFHKTWGGDQSLIKQLEDLEPEMPFWARPLWRALCKALKPLIVKTHMAATMRSVDRQAKKIGDEWAVQVRHEQMSKAVAKAQAEHPNAVVEARAMPDHPTDAVLICHKPTPGNAAQMALGFSSIEIKAPFDTD